MAALVAAVAGGCTMMEQVNQGQQVTLVGANEVPPVNTRATGRASVTVGSDCSVTATVTTEEITPTAAHIHEAASGVNGGVIVPLNKTGPNTFAAAPGAKFTPAQCDAYKKGNTYINVHSAANPNGEIRGQIRGR
jgi:hypothetical protein